MTNLFIIGNGFDLAHNLPTKYSNFKNFLNYKLNACHPSDEDDVRNLFEDIIHIINSISDNEWKNFEEDLGYYERMFPDESLKDDDDGDPEVYYNIEVAKSLINKINIFADMLPSLFQQWINTIKVEECKYNKIIKSLFKSTDKYLTFNYTMTIEKIYHISKQNICHIHGKQGENIIFGHGNKDKEYISFFNDECYGLTADIEEELNNSKMKLLKDINIGMSLLTKFLQQSHSFNKVYSYGFSYGDVDIPYIKYICKNFTTDNTIWLFDNYNEKTNKTYENILIKQCSYHGEFDTFSCK